jgi:hypothetical protein
MPFKFLEPTEFLVNSRLIKKGEAFLVRDGHNTLPFEMKVINETENSIQVEEYKDGAISTYWIKRADLEHHRELIDVLTDINLKLCPASEFTPNTGKIIE